MSVSALLATLKAVGQSSGVCDAVATKLLVGDSDWVPVQLALKALEESGVGPADRVTIKKQTPTGVRGPTPCAPEMCVWGGGVGVW